MTDGSQPTDLLNRPLGTLRISVTDRCNLRCQYCLPAELFGPDFAFLPRQEILSYEEITRLASVFIGLGVRPPTPEWGTIMSEGKDYLTIAPHVVVATGFFISLSVLCFNLLGDGLRDLLDPRLTGS